MQNDGPELFDRGEEAEPTGLPQAGRVESVSEFTRRVKALLEGGVRPGWVRGEVSNLRAQSSGHVYFSLKDAGAQLACVLFRGDAARQGVVLRDGAQVLAFGEINVYEMRGQYQLVVRTVVDDGVGRLQREFEALKRRLAEEGLFDAARKQPIPSMPATIGFVTSPTGAAVRDFIRILQRRGWCGRLVVLPAKVQGEGAAVEMAEMIAQAEQLGIFELLVIGRGGGSLEDLWAFNEEPLVRAVAACAVPVISAVGHEIDVTLCDFAADVRAETPSAAAELISSRFIDGVQRAAQAHGVLRRSVERAAGLARERLEHGRSRLRQMTPAAQVERGYLRLDDLANRLTSALRSVAEAKRARLAEARSRLVQRSPEARVQLASHRLLALWKRLQAASPKSVLKRGFVILRDEHGRPVPRRSEVRSGQQLRAEFEDGEAGLRAQ
ncbi:MAG TPA: exodeoxyribonuclease VII large subunit [Opitutaceae bacterium]|jgi:exodeoxyribonuclease VII large subunit|nr:exodeoxyribonuclease VII large subunit [Opitutaceae bacterium]